MMLDYKDESDLSQRARVAARHNMNYWHTETETEALWTDIVGSRTGNNDVSKRNRGDGKVLHQLETRVISRKYFRSALSDSFIEEPKDRLNQIRGDRLPQSIRKSDRRTLWHVSNLSHDDELTSPDHLVYLSDHLATDGEFKEVEFEGEYDDSGCGDVDQDCTLEDVTLLREIAAQWKKDQWQAISTRFNGMTGRQITPEQAKSVLEVLDNYPGSNIHRMESNRDWIRTKARPVHSAEWKKDKDKQVIVADLAGWFAFGSSIH
ncbi:hypothetical protein CDV55_104482 [Aspergillus turcosus]|uniref:Uncharacterized protein n=1 Tax=Aspergillus turcosus TaxID=1245748 RepID=A0A397H3H4_9EURO|nr:hypothetical protein CDV55_104482 [Aspergillus turcosus]RLL95760.1 hypothetical protein CFD26_102720 [Aspergillus turcosus]